MAVRINPIQESIDYELEFLRDDCVALFKDSNKTQQQIYKAGGPTPATISKWIYGETRFPRLNSILSFLLALGYRLDVVGNYDNNTSRTKRLNLSKRAITKITKPVKKVKKP